MSCRKFYKTEVKVTVLSEEPLDGMELGALHAAITDGDCMGNVEFGASQNISRSMCVDEVYKMHGDPGFFCLDEKGRDL